MAGVFQFKQFAVDQTGCAMKINTDGVLLGALATAKVPKTILDIGTGTGVVALMLAQRFTKAQIDAVEIDEAAAKTAGMNFNNSVFADRMNIFPNAIESFWGEKPDNKYDLIVSNPPFHLNSLESPKANKTVAKHTGKSFFEELISGVAGHLTENGFCWLILPLQAAGLVKQLAVKYELYVQNVIAVHSFKADVPHRELIVLGLNDTKQGNSNFVIYTEPKVYSVQYVNALKDFFTIF